MRVIDFIPGLLQRLIESLPKIGSRISESLRTIPAVTASGSSTQSPLVMLSTASWGCSGETGVDVSHCSRLPAPGFCWTSRPKSILVSVPDIFRKADLSQLRSFIKPDEVSFWNKAFCGKTCIRQSWFTQCFLWNGRHQPVSHGEIIRVFGSSETVLR